ncbi:hypothetical protein OAM07_01175 [Crocinitomicaceae bacterium]|jgi:hypothetical protein|nr:hypothetical protein [Crocinitomicaceae bacterium]MDC0459340.1 hypothetical protein [Crocinitomicaceae bacterium]
MKIFISLLSSLLLSLSVYSQKGQELTLIDRIASAETIPVIISLGEVTSEAFNAGMCIAPDGGLGKISLSSEETKISPTNGVFPKAITDSLIPLIIRELNSQFNTDKFTYNLTVNKPELERALQANNKFSVCINFVASYGYDYKQGSTKRVSDPANKPKTKLVSKRKLKGASGIRFINPKAEKLSHTPVAVRLFSPFGINQYIHDANELMKMKPPTVLINSFRLAFSKQIEKFAKKTIKKHAKVLKKRKN